MKDVPSHAPRVSVIIPTFNRAHIISQAIESVLNQTFNDYEIIVVDDGSTDTTGAFLGKTYGSRITYVGKPVNEGLAAARNTGISLAQGTYIAILDDDDLWLPEKLDRQVELMERNPDLGLVYCGSLKVNGDGDTIAEMRPTKRGDIFADMLQRNYLLGPASVALFPREVLRKTGLFDTSFSACADWDLWIRIAGSAPVDYVDDSLVKYVLHESNMHTNVRGMEKETFGVLNKYWPGWAEETGCIELKNRVYSDHAIHFAWQYYERGEEQQFKRLLRQALLYYPLNQIVMHGEGLQARENAVMDIVHASWAAQGIAQKGRAVKQTMASLYIQLAWEYYHQGSMSDFRRCVSLAYRHAFPHLPLRLAVPFVKSFMGKGTADAIHRVRKRLS